MAFEKLNIERRVLSALREMGFSKPTEVQNEVIPAAMSGKDVAVQSMTGSGKTAAFGVPILHSVEPGKGVQALVLLPTRELAEQVAGEMRKFSKYLHTRTCSVYGGVDIGPQVAALRHADIVVGTPGRVLDHMSRRTVDFTRLRALVLDEADRMLDMGFIDDIRRIIHALPKKRQTMLFSATLKPDVMRIAQHYMQHPKFIRFEPYVPKHKLQQFYIDIPEEHKPSLLVHLVKKEKPHLAIVFCGPRRETDFVARLLYENGIEAKPLHGGMTQQQRLHIMEGFHRGRPHVLVATDVAARGLDIKNISHIFNYGVPQDADGYTHRIGRTARFGKEGKAITLLSKKDHPVFSRIIRSIDIQKIVERDFPIIQTRPEPRRSFQQRRTFRRRY